MTTANTALIFGLSQFSKQGLDEVKPLPVNTRELVIFDAGVDNIQQLIEGVKPGIDWVVLNPHQDGIEQITRILANYPEITTLHLISHGAPGCLFLGNTQLNLNTLKQYINYLQSWSASDILLYGCKVAAGDAGVEFIHKLHNITQANIAASRTLTGNAGLGGDWELEIILGEAEFVPAFTSETCASYSSVLEEVEATLEDIYNNNLLPDVVKSLLGDAVQEVLGESATDDISNTADDIQFSLIDSSPNDETYRNEVKLAISYLKPVMFDLATLTPSADENLEIILDTGLETVLGDSVENLAGSQLIFRGLTIELYEKNASEIGITLSGQGISSLDEYAWYLGLSSNDVNSLVSESKSTEFPVSRIDINEQALLEGLDDETKEKMALPLIWGKM